MGRNSVQVTGRGLVGDLRSFVTREQRDLAQILFTALGREVVFAEAQLSSGAQAEEYWPDLEGLDFRDTVTDFELPEGTFLDGILRTAAQNNNANVGVSAEVAKGGTICRRDRISVS